MISRRRLLASVATVVAGSAGVIVGVRRPLPRHVPEPVPTAAWIREAAAREQVLLAAVDATAGDPVLSAVRADHVEHLRTLEAMEHGAAHPSSSGPSARLAVVDVRRAELDAASAGAAMSAQLTGADAALLASISACEASHAELLR